MATVTSLYWLVLAGLLVLAWWAARVMWTRDRRRHTRMLLLVSALTLLAGAAATVLLLEPRVAALEPLKKTLLGLSGSALALLALVDLGLVLLLAGRSLLALPAQLRLHRVAHSSDQDPVALVQAYERSLPALQRSHSVTREIEVLHELGKVRMASGESDEADESYRRRVERARSTQDLSLVSLTLDDYCAVLLEMERYDVARGRYVEALKLAEVRRDRLGVARVLYDLAWCEYLAGDCESSRVYLARAIHTAGRDHDPELQAHLLMVGGMLSLRRGDLAQARGSFEDSLRLLESQGDTEGLALARFALGTEHYVEGWHEGGREYLEESLMATPRPKWRAVAGRWLVALSWVARSRGLVDDAEEFAIWAQHLVDETSPLAKLALYCEKPEAGADLSLAVRGIAGLLDPTYDPIPTTA